MKRTRVFINRQEIYSFTARVKPATITWRVIGNKIKVTYIL